MGNTTKSLAAVLFMGVLGAASDASAINNIATCTKYTDGSGYCAGNFAGWRAIASNGSYVQFSASEYGGRGLYARYMPSGGTSLTTYSCSPNTAVLALWDTLMSYQGYWYLGWNTSGVCDYAYVVNGSQYTGF